MTAKSLYDAGQMDILSCVDTVIDSDSYYTVVFEAIEQISDFVANNYNEIRQVSHFYFSDRTIMEYYKLCRKFSKQREISLEDNPYMLEARAFVTDLLDSDCYYCCYHLQTKINHEWASGIVFYYDDNFNEFDALIDRMLEVIGFYRSKIEVLKNELVQPKIVVLPPTKSKEVAA